MTYPLSNLETAKSDDGRKKQAGMKSCECAPITS